MVALSSAYGLQLTVVAMLASPAADPRIVSYEADLSAQRGLPVQTTLTSSTKIVSITGLDASTGERMQVACLAADDRFASDVLLVPLQDLPITGAQICELSDRVIRQGSDY
jgi:hypothetical protein